METDLTDSSDDCEIIDSIDIVKQEPPGSPDIAKHKNSLDVGNTQENEVDEVLISYVPQTDIPPPDMDIKMEQFPDMEQSETPNVPELPKEAENTIEHQESSPINPEVSSTVEKTTLEASVTVPEPASVNAPESAPKIQAIPITEVITPVKIKQEPREKTPPPQPLPSIEVNFGASTSHCFPPSNIKQSPPSSPPSENPTTVNPKLKTEPIEIDPGIVGVAPQFINLDEFTMDKKRKRGYCDPLGKLDKTFFFFKYL